MSGEALQLVIRTMFSPEKTVIQDSGEKSAFLLGRKSRGSAKDIDVLIPDKHVSRKHCELKWADGDGWSVTDLDTTNGTIVDGDLISEATKIDTGSEILIGTTRINISVAGEATIAAAADATQVVDRDETFVGEDATALMSEDETAVISEGGEEMTVAEAESTHIFDAVRTRILEPGWEDIDGDGDETVLADDKTVVAGGVDFDGESTVVVASDDASETIAATQLMDELPADGADATVVVSDDATVVVSDDATVVASDDATVAVLDDATVAAPEAATAASAASVTAPVSRPSRLADEEEAEEEDIPVPDLPGVALELMDANLIDQGTCWRLAERTRAGSNTFFRTLITDGEVRFKSEIVRLVAENLELDLIENDKTLEAEALDDVQWLPVNVCERRGILPLEPRSAGEFRYATVDPYNIYLDDWLTRNDVDDRQMVLVAPEAFDNVVNRLKNRVSEDEANEIGLAIDINSEHERAIRSNIVNVDVPQLVNYFLHRGHQQGASDIHIEPMEDVLATRNRVDGILHEDTTLPLDFHSEIISRIKILSGMDVAEKRRPQDGRIGLVIRGTPIDVRVSSYPTVYGEKIVMRLLDKSALRPSPETLGLLANGLRLLKDKINAPYGLIMISGPTGSGKTTTLYSCLGSIDKNKKNVLTVEDPVEYRLRGVHQMQVNEKIGLTFASGLRTILRQDPDVIMVGECRDTETAAMAIQASLTGHIVFSTIHTNDSVGVVTRLLDIKIDPFLVANALSLAVAQRLVRKVCPHCRSMATGEVVYDGLLKDGVSDEKLTGLGIEIDNELTYVMGAGCVHCNNTGYLGRQAVFEVFEMTAEARTMIMSPDFSADDLRVRAVKGGMISLVQHGLHLVEEGVTTHEEVIRVLGEAS